MGENINTVKVKGGKQVTVTPPLRLLYFSDDKIIGDSLKYSLKI
jgi:hypothetical protein